MGIEVGACSPLRPEPRSDSKVNEFEELLDEDRGLNLDRRLAAAPEKTPPKRFKGFVKFDDDEDEERLKIGLDDTSESNVTIN